MSTVDHLVLVKVHIPASVYRACESTARRHGMEVSDVIAEHASHLAKKTKTRPRRQYTRFTAEHLEQARELATLEGMSQRRIARIVGVSPSSIQNHWHQIIRRDAA